MLLANSNFPKTGALVLRQPPTPVVRFPSPGAKLINPQTVMNSMIHPAFRRAILVTGFTAMLCATATAVTLPSITAPGNGAKITEPYVDVRVSTADLQDVQTVQILADGKSLGFAMPNSFFGEWSFPDGTHVSLLAGMDDNVKIDYTPPNGAAMFIIDGAMTGGNTFAGTYIHWPGGGITLEGDVTATFSFTKLGFLKIVLNGDAPLGTRTISGGVSNNEDFHFAWNNPPEGKHSLVAHIVTLPGSMYPPVTTITATVDITIDLPPAPEIVVQQPKGSDLIDGRASRGFGTAKAGRTGQTRTFVIRNSGSAKLKGLAITRNGANARDFTIDGPEKTSLGRGESTTFKVTFNPKAKGVRSAAIHIKSNDADENPFDIKLAGQGG